MAKQRGRASGARPTAKSASPRTGGGAGGPKPRDGKAAQEQARRLLEEQRRTEVRRRRLVAASAAVAVVVLAVIAMVVVKVVGDDNGGAGKAGKKETPESSAAAVAAVTSVPAAVLNQVGRGKVDTLPQQLKGQEALTADGKPLVLYIGAEYCPFCAAQRWPMVVALSRFGTFSGLSTSYSATDDVYPDTKTLSFHGSTYTSQYLSFQGVEVKGNERKGGDYETLDPLTPQQNKIMQTINAPPYVDKDAAGSIPFVDFGNRYIIVGGSFRPDILKNKSAEQIATSLAEPNSAIAKAVNGTANAFTAIICKLTNGQPGDVCTSAGVKAYAGSLG